MDDNGYMYMQDNAIFNFLYKNGGWFVESFFLISGTLFWMNYAPKIRGGEYSFRLYWKRRMIRIYPLMIISLFLSVTTQEIYRYHFGHYWLWCSNNNLFTFFLNLLGLQGLFSNGYSFNCPAWTLTVFFVLWIQFFLIVKIAKGRREYEFYFCVIMMLLGLTITICFPNSKTPFLNYNFGRGYVAFFAGGCIWLLFEKGSEVYRRKTAYALAIVFIILIILKKLLQFEIGPTNLVFGCIIFPGIFWICLGIGKITRILSTKPLVWIGKISFSLYLCNFPVQNILAYLSERGFIHIVYSNWKFWWLHFCCNIVVATVLNDFIERKVTPFLKKQ